MEPACFLCDAPLPELFCTAIELEIESRSQNDSGTINTPLLICDKCAAEL